ncbi:MAG TPA: hemerythrin domain-containing protein [Burkholderiales bacterium]|nr:hemerythrin domain-containing protein [Burkholderiales bacterium]
MLLVTPGSLKTEHAELRATLARAVRESGPIGAAARELNDLLQPHLAKEDLFALPPLALLPYLAEGQVIASMADAVALAGQLKNRLDELLREHRDIQAALHRLIEAARADDRVEYAEFAYRLINHAQMEDQVLYPAAILVGEFLKLKLGTAASPGA